MIRIIKGTYGLEKNGVVRPMTKHSEPFKLSAAREAELVAAGVAVYVEEPARESTKNYEKMKLAELREAADALGVDVGTKTKKEKLWQK